jgi:hypothetical protein
MVIAGMTQREIAQVITEMGRGIRAGRLEGVEYPPDYKISQQAVTLAFRRYCQRNPLPGFEQMRQIDTQRCDDIYRAMLPIITRPRADTDRDHQAYHGRRRSALRC